MAIGCDEFNKLYEEYASLVRSIVFRMHGEDEIDDLVQNIFIKIYMNYESFKGDAKPKTWIYRIAVNTIKDHWRAKKRKSWLSLFTKDTKKEVEVEDEKDTKLEVKDALKLINELLSEKLKEVIVLYSFEDLNINEISEILKIPAGTVKSRLHKAHKILKEARIVEESYE